MRASENGEGHMRKTQIRDHKRPFGRKMPHCSRVSERRTRFLTQVAAENGEEHSLTVACLCMGVSIKVIRLESNLIVATSASAWVLLEIRIGTSPSLHNTATRLLTN